ncbi:hypothetical protein [Burkholderia vietnamiensis]|uniref:hypothetical protein n=1 Tax=Burkholderia vietnamiensis TaxID=60552 RepID=UPI001CF159A3|nr:hypothetical protein [Burkholderia vietnamiensis]MCA8073891.1 hypothetical protein [Burkholderia vietnamiensis]
MILREWILWRALAHATAKRALDRIPLTGERPMQRDYFSVTLSELTEGDVLVDALVVDLHCAWRCLPRVNRCNHAPMVRRVVVVV